MRCPSCSFENKEGALVCNLCQKVLRREGASLPPRPPRPTPEISAAVVEPPRERAPIPWAILALGAVLLLWGLSATVKQYRLLGFPPYPKDASPEQILAWPGYGYVRWDRALVRKDDVIYQSGKRFTATDPRVQFEASNGFDILAKRNTLVGSYVRLNGQLPVLRYFVLTEKRVTYQRSASGFNEQIIDETTLCRRIYAPMLGTGGKMWVLSRCFPDKADLTADPWLGQGAYAGILVPLSEDKELAALDREWMKSSPAHIPADALMIVDQPPTAADDVRSWYPLGPSNALFVEVPPDSDLELAYPEGVVDLPEEYSERPNAIAAVLSQKAVKPITVPKTMRVVSLTTPPKFVEDRHLGSRFSKFGFGLALAGAAILAVTILPRLRARDRA
ncbi:MAG: hypothetical protein ACXVEF_01170 [Polyangiales bacterium]